MNIAVVGGGKRCKVLIDMIEKFTLKDINPQIVAVADINPNAPGLIKAKQNGVFVTDDYNHFFTMKDIDLILELTGNQKIFENILSKKKQTVRAVSDLTSKLFWEISEAFRLHKQTQQQLEETKLQYEVIINELIQEDVMVIAPDYSIIDINDSLLKKMGLTREKAIGKFCYEISHHQNVPCSGKEHPCPLVETLETGKPTKTTHIHLGCDNKKYFFSISCYPIFANSKIKAVIEISKDITREINMQRVLMSQEKLVSIGRLSAGVAHEINNPLTTILTTSMLLQEEIDPENQIHEDLATISNEAIRCRKIVRSLLDFARQSKPLKKQNNIGNIISESILLTRKQAAFNDIAVEKNIPDYLPLITIDKDQIQQALINLIMNAAEASVPGDTIDVSASFLPEDKLIEIAVKDTGKGMVQDQINEMFEPFFTTKDNGTGLGMAITHGIVERHGGKIDVKSKPDQGTIITIRLPLNHGVEDGD